jgi:hypothetical protein
VLSIGGRDLGIWLGLLNDSDLRYTRPKEAILMIKMIGFNNRMIGFKMKMKVENRVER